MLLIALQHCISGATAEVHLDGDIATGLWLLLRQYACSDFAVGAISYHKYVTLLAAAILRNEKL